MNEIKECILKSAESVAIEMESMYHHLKVLQANRTEENIIIDADVEKHYVEMVSDDIAHAVNAFSLIVDNIPNGFINADALPALENLIKLVRTDADND